MAPPTFGGLRVLTLESRRATEAGALIANLGGRPVVAPSLKEVPLESHASALAFGERLLGESYDLVIFLTGVGVRVLLTAIEAEWPTDRVHGVIAALGRVRIAARGPKPVAALRERGLSVWVTAPEPNTWRELIAEIEAKGGSDVLRGARVAVQEYGVSNDDLLAALRQKGAIVEVIAAYQWALPDDLEPLRTAITTLTRGDIDVVMFTSGIQRVHLQQVAETMGLGDQLRAAFRRVVVASIGPSASAELGRHGTHVDFEASHPKMGILVREAAEKSKGILAKKASTA